MTTALQVLTLVPFIVHFGQWIHARRQARKAGKPLPPFSAANAVKEVGDLVDTVQDIRAGATPPQRPSAKAKS